MLHLKGTSIFLYIDDEMIGYNVGISLHAKMIDYQRLPGISLKTWGENP